MGNDFLVEMNHHHLFLSIHRTNLYHWVFSSGFRENRMQIRKYLAFDYTIASFDALSSSITIQMFDISLLRIMATWLGFKWIAMGVDMSCVAYSAIIRNYLISNWKLSGIFSKYLLQFLCVYLFFRLKQIHGL